MILPLTSPVVDLAPIANAISFENVRAMGEVADAAPTLLPLLALGGAAAAGLALWSVGGRFVKPSVLLVASATGGYAGFTLGASLDPAIGPWIGLALGVFLGAAVGHWLFRVASGILLAAFLAVAAPTAAAVAFNYDLAERAQAIVDVVRDAAMGEDDDDRADDGSDLGAPRSLTSNDSAPDVSDHKTTNRDVLARAGAWFAGFVSDAAEGGEDIWDDLEPNERRTIIATGLLGALAGLAIGSIFPTLAMAILTSGLGAAILLSAGSRLAVHFRPEWESSLPESPIAWAAIWVSVVFLGVVLQIAPHRKRRKRPSTDDSAKD